MVDLDRQPAARRDDIIKRFDGEAIAIVGLEMDQVRKTPKGDVPVPINVAYNHHHDTAVVGKAARLVEVERDDPRFEQVGRDYVRLSGMKAWVAEEVEPSAQGLPTSAMFSDANGGEYRKSFHAYAPPYAQIVESPTHLAGAPMQIDTWNRDNMDIAGGPFVPGPYPKAAYTPVRRAPCAVRVRHVDQAGRLTPALPALPARSARVPTPSTAVCSSAR